MNKFFSDKRKEKLMNVTSVVILIFVSVMSFLFIGAGQNENATLLAQTFMMRNSMFLVIVAEFIILILLFFKLSRK